MSQVTSHQPLASIQGLCLQVQDQFFITDSGKIMTVVDVSPFGPLLSLEGQELEIHPDALLRMYEEGQVVLVREAEATQRFPVGERVTVTTYAGTTWTYTIQARWGGALMVSFSQRGSAQVFPQQAMSYQRWTVLKLKEAFQNRGF